MLADRDSSHRANSVDKTTKTQKVLLIRRSGEQNVELERLFEPDVWMISYAPDNAAALELATAEAFDLVVTSTQTTGAEDVLLLRRLRMVQPRTRLIIQITKKMPGDVLNALRYHAFSFFSVPLPTEDLRTLIQDAMNEPVWDDGIELIQGTPDHVVLLVRCDRGTLDRLEQFMREGIPLPKVENEEVAFAFREIVMNAMEQRGKLDSEQFVEVCYLKSKRQVMCRVKDTGIGFSLQEALKEAKLKSVEELGAIQTCGENENVPPGLGILMAEKFVDELICSEKGNEIFLIKYLPKVENEKL
jgi:DNA-binding NarL/FixJ family response regulator